MVFIYNRKQICGEIPYSNIHKWGSFQLRACTEKFVFGQQHINVPHIFLHIFVSYSFLHYFMQKNLWDINVLLTNQAEV